MDRLDRNTVELLNELRIAGTGIQVMFAFLLVVPFNTGWKRVDAFERTVYFVTLSCVALAAFLLMAPTVHHRLLFRRGEKPFLVAVANVYAIIGMVFLAVGFVGILILLADVVIGGAAPTVVGASRQRSSASCGSGCPSSAAATNSRRASRMVGLGRQRAGLAQPIGGATQQTGHLHLRAAESVGDFDLVKLLVDP